MITTRPVAPVASADPWEAYAMSVDDVVGRLQRITHALEEKSVPYAVVGGQAVALWVATREPAAVRTTKDVDLLIRRDDLPQARAAALSVEMDYFEVMGVGMFLDRQSPNPRSSPYIWFGPAKRFGPSTSSLRPRSTNGKPSRGSLRSLCPAWC